MRVFILSCVLAATAALPASADERGHIRALGGVTFGGETAPAFGGGVAFRVAEGLSLTAEAGYMTNVADSDLQDAVELAEDGLNRVLPVDVTIDLDVPAFYGLAGLRYEFPGETIHPYVEASGGFASLSTDLEVSVGGFDLPDILGDELDGLGAEEETKGMIAAGAGVAIDMSDTVGLDLGYRYGRVLTDDAININKVYGALRFRF